MSRRAWLNLAGAAFLWGASYMFIKVALEDLSEGVIVFVRTLLGAAILVPLALRAGAVRALVERGRWTLALAATQVIVPFGLITYGERWVDSGLAGILVATAPIFVALLALRIDQDERSHGWGLVGVFTGLAGVALLFGADLGGKTETLIGGVMILGAAASYAGASFIVKHRFRGVPPVGAAASTMVLSALAYLPLAAATAPTQAPGLDAAASLFALGAGGTGLAFLFYYALLDEVGPARGAIIAYVAPAFSVGYGVTILGESLSAATVAGLVLILVGSWLGAEGRLPRLFSGTSAEADLAVGVRPGLGQLREVKPLLRSPEQARQQPQPGVLRS